MNPPVVLIVEDNDEVRELLKVILSSRGFQTQDTASGKSAIDICEDHTPDIVVLDLTLPDLDGLEVCKKMKSFPQMESVPILICSARAHVSERVKGLEAGADDYLTKPFDPIELVARIKVLLRRLGWETPEDRKPIQSGTIKMDTRNYQMIVSGRKNTELTRREFDVLYLLIQNSPGIVSRAEISKTILAREHDQDSRVIDMHIAQLRKKLGRDLAEHLATVPHQGYQWKK